MHYRCHSSGGVELYALNGKIKLSNTLDSRLKLLGRQVSLVAILYLQSLLNSA